jgi:oligoendopeptidase F
MTANVYPRAFVPADLHLDDFSSVEPLYRELLDRTISSSAELDRWLGDLSELSAVVAEAGTRRYVDKSCHTDDPEIERRFLKFIEEIEPPTKPLFFALQKKFLDSPHRAQLSGTRYQVLARQWQAEVDVFREENVPLETESAKLNSEYDKICGAMMVEFRGRQYTQQQLARFLEEPDRPTREEAWIAGASRRLADRQPLEDIFDKLLALRRRIAANAEMSDFRAYIWKSLKRFDYTPADCQNFAESVARGVVPLMRELDARRAASLGLDRLRPGDFSVDPHQRPPHRPVPQEQTQALVAKTQAIFQRLSPMLAEDFASLSANGILDLDSRNGKQPG